MPSINTFSTSLSASWGPNDPEVESVWTLLKDGASKLEDENIRDEADFWADRIYEKLREARSHYMTITASGFQSRPTSEQEAAYNSLYSSLWSAYKDRFMKLMSIVGYEMAAAIFANDEQYEAQIDSFMKRQPELGNFKQVITSQKNSWQDTLRDNRNAHEHSGDLRDKLDLRDINNPFDAKKMFIYITRSIESLGITSMSYKIERMWDVVHINPNATVFDRVARYEIQFSFGRSS